MATLQVPSGSVGRLNTYLNLVDSINGNIPQPGDLVVVHENSPILTKWPLARVIEVYPGKDNLVRVAKIKTAYGTYTRPVSKLAAVLPTDEQS